MANNLYDASERTLRYGGFFMVEQNYLSLSEAARIAPGKPHKASIWRWCRKGVKARTGDVVKLRHVRAGGKVFTRADWLEQFLAELVATDQEHFDRPAEPQAKPANARHLARREKEIAASKSRLREAGVLT
jgi:hypothetical protein